MTRLAKRWRRPSQSHPHRSICMSAAEFPGTARRITPIRLKDCARPDGRAEPGSLPAGAPLTMHDQAEEATRRANHHFKRHGCDLGTLYRDFATSIPDEVNTIGGLLTSPEGEAVAAIAACYNGSLQEGDKVLRRRQKFRSAPGRSHRSGVVLPSPDPTGCRGSARAPVLRQNQYDAGNQRRCDRRADRALCDNPSPHSLVSSSNWATRRTG